MPPPTRNPIQTGQTIRISYLGRIVSHKRPDKLVEEWQDLCKLPGFSPASLDLYGGDYGNGMINQIRDTIRRLGLELPSPGELLVLEPTPPEG